MATDRSAIPPAVDRHLTVDEATNAPVPSLLSVNVGMPRNVAWQGKTVYTGVWKEPVQGPRMVRRLNIDGDGQGDTVGHGGEQRAVFVYQIQSYRYWQEHFGRNDFSYGQFGENFTVEGLPDDEVCVGDRYHIGEAEFEVTQPRVTCYRVGLRLGEPDLPALLVGHRRPGFYMRVVSEGRVQAGDRIVRTRTGPRSLSVADVDALLYLPDRDFDKLRLALQIPALSPGWQESFRELLAEATDKNDATEPDASTEPAWSGFRPLRVTEVVSETATVSSVYLAAPDGSELRSALAGQYLTIRATGAGHPAPVRTYSISSAPNAGSFRISVKREPHGIVSTYLSTELQPGVTLEVAAPRGEFVLDGGNNPVLLVSAGIGVTPVLSMLHQLASQRSQRDIWWIHGARNAHEQALGAEAHDLLASLPSAHEHVFYSAATHDEGGPPMAALGRLNQDELSRLDVPPSASAYVCGPAGFMADMQHALAAVGVETSRIRTELFAALPSINPGLIAGSHPRPHQPPGPPGIGPMVAFVRSGIETPFTNTTRNVLELAEACDISTRWSCRSGVCHTCTTPLVSGNVSYHPAPLEAPAEGEILICCAQPSSDIVLDM